MNGRMTAHSAGIKPWLLCTRIPAWRYLTHDERRYVLDTVADMVRLDMPVAHLVAFLTPWEAVGDERGRADRQRLQQLIDRRAAQLRAAFAS